MAAEEFPVALVSETLGSSQGVFVLDEDEPGDDCTLEFHYAGGRLSRKSWNYFDAMCQIRNELEVIGWRPVCYGVSRTAYPSGMSLDMGRGLKTYKLVIGQQARTADLVGIFEPGPEVEPVTVAQQTAFFDDWLQSLGRKPPP